MGKPVLFDQRKQNNWLYHSLGFFPSLEAKKMVNLLFVWLQQFFFQGLMGSFSLWIKREMYQ